jgi:hypothetical protein
LTRIAGQTDRNRPPHTFWDTDGCWRGNQRPVPTYALQIELKAMKSRLSRLEVLLLVKTGAARIRKSRKIGIFSSDMVTQSSRMPTSEKFRARYSYRLRLDAGGQISAESSELTKKEIQAFVDISLGLMTAGCEQCIHSQGPFCEKLGRQVKVQDARCEFFMRRPSAVLQYQASS